jgi:hypothetical protein
MIIVKKGSKKFKNWRIIVIRKDYLDIRNSKEVSVCVQESDWSGFEMAAAFSFLFIWN